jgi:uncharacterized protein (TIGR00304 family)
MSRNWGWLLIATGILLVVVSMMQMPDDAQTQAQTWAKIPTPAQNDTQKSESTGFGGVILIGPIPIVFGSSPQMAMGSMIMALVLMLAAFLLFRGRA